MYTVLDTTMRDGAQHNKISFSVEDKLGIAEALEQLDVDFIEYGAPSFDIETKDFENRTKLSPDKLVAFGMTARAGTEPERDEGILKLIAAKGNYVSLVGKSDRRHVEKVLRTDAGEYLNNIRKSVATITKSGKKVIFDAEHFFDGYAYDRDYAMASLTAAAEGGAEILNLCDTNGGSLPAAIRTAVSECKKTFSVTIGIHAHNDAGLATANTLAALEAGAEHVQGTLLGLGERSGNAALSTILPLMKRLGLKDLPGLNLLTPVCRTVAEISNIAIPDSAPYIGAAAFTHKAGLHADGVLKESDTFEFISPESVGNVRRLVLSKQAGRHLVRSKLEGVIPEATEPEILSKVYAALKEREALGYTFEAAEASFYIMAARLSGRKVDFFKTVDYTVIDSSDALSHAKAEISVDGVTVSAKADGNGPVHALDLAMRECMLKFFPAMDSVSLVDYKVRVIDPKSATGARVRVSITSTDGKRTWKTIGVSGNVVHASFIALEDSYRFALNDDFNGLFA